MKMTTTLILSSTLIILCFCLCNAETKGNVTVPAPTPAPQPAPEPVNITQLLSTAGPFGTFLSYLESTKIIDNVQTQANNTVQGLTLFVPKNNAFSSLKNPSLSNLTQDQLKQLCLFHALPKYYSFSDFTNLSIAGPVSTLAGGSYTLNITDSYGSIGILTGWTVTEISSSVASAFPVAVYQVDAVLLPVAIFGTNIPPMPAPLAPPPKAADTDTDTDTDGAPTPADIEPSVPKEFSASCRVVGSFVLALLGMLAVMCL